MKILLVILLASVAFGCETIAKYAPAAAPICRIFADDDVCDAVEAVSDVVEETEEEPDE